MKKFSLFVLISSLAFSPVFSFETEIADLENELLSLEHEFLDSLEESLETNPSELEEASIEMEELSLDGVLTSVILETEETAPFITEKVIVEEIEPAIPSSPVLISSSTPSYPHEEAKESLKNEVIQISFAQVFSNSPFIYSLLLGMSFTSIAICLYIILRVKEQTNNSEKLSKEIETKFLAKDFKEASLLCSHHKNWLSKILLSGINSKKYGLNAVLDNMKSEGKRATISAWQQLGILQDIAIISPMLGLLGTVIGLFYAFYDLNRSFNSLSHLLDGLGISVGTTVAGIFVAILSMILHSLTKFRLVRSLAKIETKASSLAYLIESGSEES